MSMLKKLDYAEASAEAKAVMDDIKATRDVPDVNNVWKVLANDPRQMKQFWDEGKLAVMHGVGYLDSPRSHFRSMDIWHTCEADKVGTEGWLGRAVRDLDWPNGSLLVAILRGGHVRVPRGNTILEPRDELIIMAEPEVFSSLNPSRAEAVMDG